MPKKQFVRVSKLRVSEPSVIFQALYEATLENDREFVTRTDDPEYKPFADELIDQHYPPRHQLLLDS